MNSVPLRDDEILRYSRHIFLPQIDLKGQTILKNTHALIVGLGGLGSPVAQYLAASGIGQLSLVDFDVVDESNLVRQPIHSSLSLGQLKTDSAKNNLSALNPNVEVHTYAQKADQATLPELMNGIDVVLDCSDNFATRQTVNCIAWQKKVPLISAAVIRLEGQLCVVEPQSNTPCYRCLYDQQDTTDTCANSGVLSPVAGLLGCIQATETIKYLLNIGDSFAGKLLLLDAQFWQLRTVKLSKDSACPVCSV